MKIPLRRGRLITDADRAGAEDVMLIGEQTARTLWPNADPIGQHVRIGGADSGPWRTIVGVVGDVRHRALASQPTLQMYTPQAQLTAMAATGGRVRVASEALAALTLRQWIGDGSEIDGDLEWPALLRGLDRTSPGYRD